jgi:hypothetical protein
VTSLPPADIERARRGGQVAQPRRPSSRRKRETVLKPSGAACEAGAGWADLAHPLGVSGRQAPNAATYAYVLAKPAPPDRPPETSAAWTTL